MEREIILETKQATKHFGGLAAVEKVDMTIYKGEILGLIGPNGAGKTTFVNIITGMLPITSGKVYYKGQDITGWPAFKIGRLGIARTFQIVKPFRGMTVQENVAVGAMFGRGGVKRSPREALEHVDHIIEFVGMADLRDKHADELTLPYLKRLELAKALAMDPELLFLDEVMAGLNTKEIESAMALVRKINEKGITILVIEHVMKAIVGVTQRVFVLNFGQELAQGTPQEVLNNPAVIEAYLGEKFVARFFRQQKAA
ncbi:MAG TPA: ABC transporter ATP-binding protein [Anaerolineae bacterium]|nr:ABC transporter ATP-binding protein [Anaerolineae bacterium]